MIESYLLSDNIGSSNIQPYVLDLLDIKPHSGLVIEYEITSSSLLSFKT